MKKKLLVILLALPLLFAAAGAVGEAAYTPVKINSQESVYSVYACYEVLGDYASVTVDFADSVKSYAYSNFVGGKLLISVASASEIDLSETLARVTAADADGNTAAPGLRIEKLTLNGETQDLSALFPVSMDYDEETGKISVYSSSEVKLFIAEYSDGLLQSIECFDVEAEANTLEYDFGEESIAFIWDANMRPLCGEFTTAN